MEWEPSNYNIPKKISPSKYAVVMTATHILYMASLLQNTRQPSLASYRSPASCSVYHSPSLLVVLFTTMLHGHWLRSGDCLFNSVIRPLSYSNVFLPTPSHNMGQNSMFASLLVSHQNSCISLQSSTTSRPHLRSMYIFSFIRPPSLLCISKSFQPKSSCTSPIFWIH